MERLADALTQRGTIVQDVADKVQERLLEPIAVGGQDSGPGPYDFVLAGLGACTSTTFSPMAVGTWPVVNTRTPRS